MISPKSNNILFPTFRKITLIDVEKISHVQAAQNYCSLYRDDGTHVLTSMSFGMATQVLEPFGFYQCHKSYVLKLDKFVRYFKEGNAEIVGNVMVPVARRRRQSFLEVLNGGIDRLS